MFGVVAVIVVTPIKDTIPAACVTPFACLKNTFVLASNLSPFIVNTVPDVPTYEVGETEYIAGKASMTAGNGIADDGSVPVIFEAGILPEKVVEVVTPVITRPF